MRTWILLGTAVMVLGVTGLLILPQPDPGDTPDLDASLPTETGSLLNPLIRWDQPSVALWIVGLLGVGSLLAWFKKTPPARGTRPLPASGDPLSFLGGVALWMLGALLITVWPTRLLIDGSGRLFSLLYGNSLTLQLVLLVGGLILVPLGVVRSNDWVPGGSSASEGLLRGLQGYLRVVPVVLIAQVLNRQLLDLLEIADAVPYSMVFFHSAATPYEEIALVLLVAGLAPVAEELFFRGVLYRALGRFFPVGSAALLSALVFASTHFSLQQFLPLAVLGYFLARYYENSDSLLTPITMHTLQNASSLLILYVI